MTSQQNVSADAIDAAPRAIAAFSNSYAAMPDRFFARQAPSRVEAPRLVAFNPKLAAELGLDIDAIEELGPEAIFAGNIVPPGADPIAMAYAGHQFGHFTPQLGDGRAILMGEVVDREGRRRDIQWKGSGPTPFSRRGDGRAALGPALREYLVSEAMHALGIPTTRGLAVAATGEAVYREQPLPGAVFTRVAASHIRIGTFQYFAARRDGEGVRRLADHAIERHYPETRDAGRPYLALLEGVIERQAALIAKWMHVGFIHGVMNTDNMSISGETIDFGPCAFMDAYDPGTVFSSIDETGRYAYANQPRIAAWNLARLAETLLPLIDGDVGHAVELATTAVSGFSPRFETHWLAGMRAKIGLETPAEGDMDLARGLLDVMHRGGADFTLTFRRLGDALAEGRRLSGVRALFADPAAFDAWSRLWFARLDAEPGGDARRAAAMRRVNPAVIPRNHNVEAALAAAAGGDFGPFHQLSEVLARPYEDAPGYIDPPPADGRVYQTFCGT